MFFILFALECLWRHVPCARASTSNGCASTSNNRLKEDLVNVVDRERLLINAMDYLSMPMSNVVSYIFMRNKKKIGQKK